MPYDTWTISRYCPFKEHWEVLNKIIRKIISFSRYLRIYLKSCNANRYFNKTQIILLRSLYEINVIVLYISINFAYLQYLKFLFTLFFGKVIFLILSKRFSLLLQSAQAKDQFKGPDKRDYSLRFFLWLWAPPALFPQYF